MRALCLVGTLKRSPEPSNAESLAEVVLAALREHGVETETIRLTDHRIGYSAPGQNWTYWNKGPGPGEEEWLTTDDRDWSISTGKTAARNIVAVARALEASPVPPPPGS